MPLASDLLIRDARDDERATIERLTLTAYAEYATIMAPSAWAGLNRAVVTALSSGEEAERIVAEQAGTLVGSVMLYPAEVNAYRGLTGRATWPELRLLAVLPEARGRGVGMALVNECVQRARRAGATALGLHTSDSMQVAMRMYEQMGFVRDPAYDFRPDGAELVKAYRRDLTGPTNRVE